MAVIALEKNRKGQIIESVKILLEKRWIAGVKCLVFVDAAADVFDLKSITWMVLNNIDASRDVSVHDGVMIVDGTRKTIQFDGFGRPWPNIIVSDDATIKLLMKNGQHLAWADLLNRPR